MMNILAYKIYHKKWKVFAVTIAIYTARQMVVARERVNLCVFMRERFLEIMKRMKKSKYPIKYGSLITCLAFMFMNDLPATNNRIWDKFSPIDVQIRQHIRSFGTDNKVLNTLYSSWFKNIQDTMQDRERFPLYVVSK